MVILMFLHRLKHCNKQRKKSVLAIFQAVDIELCFLDVHSVTRNCQNVIFYPTVMWGFKFNEAHLRVLLQFVFQNRLKSRASVISADVRQTSLSTSQHNGKSVSKSKSQGQHPRKCKNARQVRELLHGPLFRVTEHA